MTTKDDNIDRSKERIKKGGEVFTPAWLVNEMIDKLEIDWSNPPMDKTFLDPTCGNGNFLVALAERGIPLKNIYGVDLMEDNVVLTKQRIGGGNILQADATTYDYSFGNTNVLDMSIPIQFDYIAGNPPYEKALWAELIPKFYSLLVDKGYMASIHPGGWRFAIERSRKNIKEVRRIYTNNKVIYMELNSFKKGKETFGASTDYDVVIIKKEPSDGKVIVKMEIDGLQEINIKEMGMIPTDRLTVFEKLKWKE